MAQGKIKEINTHWAWTDEDFIRIINILNEKYKQAKRNNKRFLIIYEIRNKS